MLHRFPTFISVTLLLVGVWGGAPVLASSLEDAPKSSDQWQESFPDPALEAEPTMSKPDPVPAVQHDTGHANGLEASYTTSTSSVADEPSPPASQGHLDAVEPTSASSTAPGEGGDRGEEESFSDVESNPSSNQDGATSQAEESSRLEEVEEAGEPTFVEGSTIPPSHGNQESVVDPELPGSLGVEGNDSQVGATTAETGSVDALYNGETQTAPEVEASHESLHNVDSDSLHNESHQSLGNHGNFLGNHGNFLGNHGNFLGIVSSEEFSSYQTHLSTSTPNNLATHSRRIQDTLLLQRLQSPYAGDSILQVGTLHIEALGSIPSANGVTLAEESANPSIPSTSPGHGSLTIQTWQAQEYLAQVATLPSVASPLSPSALTIPNGYQQISPGIYVPQEYLRQPPVVATARQIPELSSDSAGHLTWSSASMAPMSVGQPSGMWEFPLYPLPQPVPITSPVGWRVHPVTGVRRFHAGTDLGVPSGTPVLASVTGTVEFAGWMDGYGYTVIVRHESGQVRTLYAHLSSIGVQVNQGVMQGEVIAHSGSTGLSTGPHLHYEIQQWDGQQWVAIDSTPIVQYAQHILESGVQLAFAPFNSGWLADTASQLEIRVALAEDVSALSVGSSTTALITDMNGQVLGSIPAGTLNVHSGQPLLLGNQSLPSAFFLIPTDGGYLSVDGQWYRGRVLVAQRPGGLIAVNWVEMEDYLISVVGSESYPTWDEAALQAQAIAARSYAFTQLYRHRDDTWYEVTATPRHQAYSGIEREFDSTRNAVAATRGMVLVPTSAFPYDNRIVGGVVEAQYAATSEISRTHHRGFGMSQWGAAEMASQGHDYSSILGHYYPNTQIARAW